MSDQIIRKAFESRLKAWADAQTPAIPVAWMNQPFTPPAGNPTPRYLRAHTLPASTQYGSIGGDVKDWKGIYQVTFCMPVGTGVGAVESLLPSLSAAFAQTFLQDGLRIFMLRPFSARPGYDDTDRYLVPVDGAYQAFTVS
jgi:hypothetical protein